MKFVIHHHVTVPEHYDLMLEEEDSLLTFRIERGDVGKLVTGPPLTAERISDHRKRYLSYEGPVSCDRGHVSFFDRGEYEKISSDMTTFTIALTGEKIKGRYRFSRSSEEKYWTIQRD
ncbi:MAG TPA: DNA polymerase ligase N-terminal domain-containing protein [Spirochaetota bacterium]|nr:DNA polymerase ligase N-terminal domain-containing protein [Spirochaetota bacterium]HPI90619.1 DNA polymerase ligase N-terminal domain-containing protein [Spirochaetota bacterium]HPR46861.1 DNA polymerase ligase N-terminal domain-containing protein [Spirochaetota bacterium]